MFVSQSTFIKKNKLITDSTYQIYRFGNEYVEVSSFDGNEQIDITRIRYEKITKVRKTKSHFLFYLGVVVSESGIIFIKSPTIEKKSIQNGDLPAKGIRY